MGVNLIQTTAVSNREYHFGNLQYLLIETKTRLIDMFQNVRDAFEATGRDLMYSNTPDSAIILYAYIGGVASFQRDLNTLVGTSVVYQDMDGVVFLRTRYLKI